MHHFFENLIANLNPYLNASNLTRINEIKKHEPKTFGTSVRPKGLSVIILNLDKPEYIIPLVHQLLDQAKVFFDNSHQFEIIIGDTGTTDLEVLKLYHLESIKVVKGLHYHFSKNNNQLLSKQPQHLKQNHAPNHQKVKLNW